MIIIVILIVELDLNFIQQSQINCRIRISNFYIKITPFQKSVTVSCYLIEKPTNFLNINTFTNRDHTKGVNNTFQLRFS